MLLTSWSTKISCHLSYQKTISSKLEILRRNFGERDIFWRSCKQNGDACFPKVLYHFVNSLVKYFNIFNNLIVNLTVFCKFEIGFLFFSRSFQYSWLEEVNPQYIEILNRFSKLDPKSLRTITTLWKRSFFVSLCKNFYPTPNWSFW